MIDSTSVCVLSISAFLSAICLSTVPAAETTFLALAIASSIFLSDTSCSGTDLP